MRFRSFSHRSIEYWARQLAAAVASSRSTRPRLLGRRDSMSWVVRADVPDMREREGDHLAGVGRIGEDLLVSGH
jgi:hypothetical protein